MHIHEPWYSTEDFFSGIATSDDLSDRIRVCCQTRRLTISPTFPVAHERDQLPVVALIDFAYPEIAHFSAAQSERLGDGDLAGPMCRLKMAITGCGASGSVDRGSGSAGQLHLFGEITLPEEEAKRCAFCCQSIGAAACGDMLPEILRGKISSVVVQLLQLLCTVMFPGPL